MNLFRGGEGFTPLERETLAESLELEVAIRGLYLLATKNASIRNRVDRLKVVKNGTSTRSIKQQFWPVAIIRPDGRPERLVLSDTATIVHNNLGTESSDSMRWSAVIEVHEGGEKNEKIETVRRPELITWNYSDGPGVEYEWAFAQPADVLSAIEGGPARLEQELAIYRFQRIIGALA